MPARIVASTTGSDASDVRIVRGHHAEAHVLEEAGVDDPALVEVGAAVADVVDERLVGVAVLRQADEVATGAERTVGGQRPRLEVALELVGHAAPHGGRRGVPVAVGDLRSRDQAGDLGGDRRGREAALLLPALGAERGPVRGDEVRRRLDVRLVVVVPREPDGERHDQRIGALVELGVEAVRRHLAVGQAVARHRAVRQLLALEQEARHVARGAPVAGEQERGPGLVEVAAEDLAVGAEVRVRGITGGDGLAPRGRERRRDGAGERLVLGRLHVERAQAVLALQRAPTRPGNARGAPRRDELPGVAAPAADVGPPQSAEAAPERALRGAHRARLAVGEAQGEPELPPAPRVDLGGLDEVPLGRVGERRGEPVGRAELGQPVAGRAGEAVGDRPQGPVGVERAVDGDGVVAVGRVGRGHRVRADEDVVPAARRDRPAVGAAVARAAAAVAVERRVQAHVELEVRQPAAQRGQARAHHHGRSRRVGQVVGDDAVAAALGGGGHAAAERAGVERAHGVGRVARLQVGERRPVGHHVLERLDVRVVVGREVDVAQDPVGDRVPDLRTPVARRADAVLARQVEVRQRARPVGRGAARSGRCAALRVSGGGGQRGERARDRDGERTTLHRLLQWRDRRRR